MEHIFHINKPKMIYFRWSREKYPEYLKKMYDRTYLKGLMEFFDVVVISENCDYADVCERFQPDLVLFESGNNGYQDPPLRITGTKAFSEIPKIGLMRSDAFCASRTIFLSDMDRWGVETFFTVELSVGQYTPEIANQVFIWPWSIDTDVYYDYGENKIIPILLTGHTDSLLYSWRKSVRQSLKRSFQCLIMPHLAAGGDETRALYDEKFGRLLNASLFVPTCGGMIKSIVNKHLEIPACKSCLVTEKTPAAEAFGFVDMENCVFADEHDVVDKLNYLMEHPDVLQRITQNGYDFVRNNHTAKQRSQIRQWYELNKVLKPGQRIVQTGWFKPLYIVDSSSEESNLHIVSSGEDRLLIKRGDEFLQFGKYDEAIALYKQCLKYASYIPEPKLRIAVCYLYKGDPINAYFWLRQNIKLIQSWKGLEPDPVEWGYLLIILLCCGKITEAIELAVAFSSLHRLELDRARWAVFAAANMQEEMLEVFPYVDVSKMGYRKSVHQLPNLNFEEAIQDYCKILSLSNQELIVSKLLKQKEVSREVENKKDINKEKLIIESLADYIDKLETLDYDMSRKYLEDIIKRKVGDRPLFLWGSGGGGFKILNMLKSLQIDVCGIIDSNSGKQGLNMGGIIIYPPQFLSEVMKTRSPYVIVASVFITEINAELEKMGFIKERDYFNGDRFLNK